LFPRHTSAKSTISDSKSHVSGGCFHASVCLTEPWLMLRRGAINKNNKTKIAVTNTTHWHGIAPLRYMVAKLVRGPPADELLDGLENWRHA
jgi:hypothetical protein